MVWEARLKISLIEFLKGKRKERKKNQIRVEQTLVLMKSKMIHKSAPRHANDWKQLVK